MELLLDGSWLPEWFSKIIKFQIYVRVARTKNIIASIRKVYAS